MYHFSPKSLKKLNECDEVIQKIMFDVIQIVDITILEGFRNEEKQNEMFMTGKSKLEWPNSKHNSNPSQAIDIAPYPIIWPDPLKYPHDWQKYLARFYYLGGIVIGLGRVHGVRIRWGGDWNMNNSFTDQTFDDLVHFEISG